MIRGNRLMIVPLMACLIAGLLFAVCSPAQSVPNSISGHVYRSDAKKPAAGARIDASNNRGMYWLGETYSAANGSYILTGLPAGRYIMKV
jgi:hypothetical protein